MVNCRRFKVKVRKALWRYSWLVVSILCNLQLSSHGYKSYSKLPVALACYRNAIDALLLVIV